jgi:lipoprotein-anchoring transpeptidase ErfK/SrfK
MKRQPENLPRRPYRNSQLARKSNKKTSAGKIFAIVLLLAVIFAVPAYAYVKVSNDNSKKAAAAKISGTDKVATTKTVSIVQKPATTTPAVQTVTTACTNNTLTNVIIASISQRHLWACDGAQVEYQTAVITGDMNVVADATPVGTYHIYSKVTDTHLIGSDSRGSWDDYVNYWMPFLDNEYGAFGLHDATWRAPTDFGTISPYSDDASHGCIELPLAAATWLYNWASIGTTVTVES